VSLLSGQLGVGRFRNERRMFSFPGAHTWTIPAGVTQVFAFVIGGGGGGRGSTESNSGGAGGGYAQGVISGLTPGNTITCTVGQGGTAGNNMSLGTQSNGGASSFGSYLTGNGGEKGVGNMGSTASTTSSGGTASTSGVSEAFTATGGNGGYQDGGDNSPCAFGGGASGSPFGTPKSTTLHGSSHPGKSMVIGGSGWYGTQNHQYITQLGSMGNCNIGSCGMGGWGTIAHYSAPKDQRSFSIAEGPRGGHGRIGARGGRGALSNCDFSNYYGGDDKTQQNMAEYYNSNARMGGIQEGGQAEDGTSLDWWFPWEMDGGGGGGFNGAPMHDGAERPFSFSAANGGNGSGGGGCNAMSNNASGSGNMNSDSTNTAYSGMAGSGGFGGGGGGLFTSQGSNHFYYYGGNGGVGGGGGSCSWYQAGNYYKAGMGGDGIVAIYW